MIRDLLKANPVAQLFAALDAFFHGQLLGTAWKAEPGLFVCSWTTQDGRRVTESHYYDEWRHRSMFRGRLFRGGFIFRFEQ